MRTKPLIQCCASGNIEVEVKKSTILYRTMMIIKSLAFLSKGQTFLHIELVVFMHWIFNLNLIADMKKNPNEPIWFSVFQEQQAHTNS
jgi:hypothetical protein